MAITLDNQNNKILMDSLEIANSSGLVGGVVQVTPYGPLTATDLQTALEQLADQSYRTDEEPTGPNVQEGDLWYDTNDDQLKVYRETSVGVFDWVPIIVSNESETSDNLDAGSY
jgi:hypothetical protein